MIKDDQKVKLELFFESYERHSRGELVKVIIERDSFLEALKTMVDNMSLYLDSETIEDEGMTGDDVIGSIEESNGDGCDFIYSLKDLLSGEVLIDGGADIWKEETW